MLFNKSPVAVNGLSMNVASDILRLRGQPKKRINNPQPFFFSQTKSVYRIKIAGEPFGTAFLATAMMSANRPETFVSAFGQKKNFGINLVAINSDSPNMPDFSLNEQEKNYLLVADFIYYPLKI